MFFAEDRIPIMQKMILARTKEEREKFLDQLLPLQKQDFIGLYREMAGYPVTIRCSIRRCTNFCRSVKS
jgi:Phosphoenolpyruvate synthase/pyruvate phosphate dikinase